MNKDYGVDPGFYCAGLYSEAAWSSGPASRTGGKSDDKTALMAAMKSMSLTDTPRRPIKFDHFGSGRRLHIRHLDKANGKLVNSDGQRPTTMSVSSGPDEKKFLRQPVYSRDFRRSNLDANPFCGAV
jgi:branched-chain amino acid transport system substrate-binding protein